MRPAGRVEVVVTVKIATLYAVAASASRPLAEDPSLQGFKLHHAPLLLAAHCALSRLNAVTRGFAAHSPLVSYSRVTRKLAN